MINTKRVLLTAESFIRAQLELGFMWENDQSLCRSKTKVFVRYEIYQNSYAL